MSPGDNVAGSFLQQPGGYRAFIPKPLPRRLELSPELIDALSRADRALGRLDGAAEILPNPELMVAMYSRKEALLSSQIEGTQASLVDVLEYEAGAGGGRAAARTPTPDVQEVLNHQRAMDSGLERLTELPISNRLLREIHAVLMQGVRGQDRRPGEFRRSQNWIGTPGSSIEEATFVPPPVSQMHDALADLEQYIHGKDPTPILIKCGLVHYQFETIHPFEDGNGRMGRLLITFLLAERDVLARPLLYISVFLKRHKSEYYALLNRVRETGRYADWLLFFLRGVRGVATEATDTARTVLRMRTEHLELVKEAVPSAHAAGFVDVLLRSPAVTVSAAARLLSVSYQTANTLVAAFEDLQLVEEITGGGRNRVFLYRPYLDVLGGDMRPS